MIPATAAGQWAAFQQILLGQGLEDHQLKLAQVCFYAGMEAMQRINFHIGQPQVTEQQAGVILAHVTAELERFGHSLAAQLGQKVEGRVQ